MSIIKIKDLCLCTGLIKDNNENRAAYDFLMENNVKFNHLGYWNPEQHADLFQSLSTWDPNKTIDRFPIVHFLEIDSDFNYKAVVLVGFDEISNSNVVELSKL